MGGKRKNPSLSISLSHVRVLRFHPSRAIREVGGIHKGRIFHPRGDIGSIDSSGREVTENCLIHLGRLIRDVDGIPNGHIILPRGAIGKIDDVNES